MIILLAVAAQRVLFINEYKNPTICCLFWENVAASSWPTTGLLFSNWQHDKNVFFWFDSNYHLGAFEVFEVPTGDCKSSYFKQGSGFAEVNNIPAALCRQTLILSNGLKCMASEQFIIGNNFKDKYLCLCGTQALSWTTFITNCTWVIISSVSKCMCRKKTLKKMFDFFLLIYNWNSIVM